ncbi:unnamed protein product [Commensalibacter communis]|nr:unnamed protein product [Commensalibacter communis]CAI3946629.1 unnamed protein product [Commensalibacter communis]
MSNKNRFLNILSYIGKAIIHIVFTIIEFILSYIEVIIGLLTIILVYFCWPALIMYIVIAFIIGTVMMFIG